MTVMYKMIFFFYGMVVVVVVVDVNVKCRLFLYVVCGFRCVCSDSRSVKPNFPWVMFCDTIFVGEFFSFGMFTLEIVQHTGSHL